MRHPFDSRSAKARSLASQVECLESRQLLSALPVAYPMFTVGRLAGNPNPPAGAFTPAQIQQAYRINQVGFDGTRETIAIVDAYDDPNIVADLDHFDQTFGLTSSNSPTLYQQYGAASSFLTTVNQTGGSSLPAADSTGGWETEEALDVEWAHAVAPGAKILLVEASSANSSDLLQAVSYAAANANVVSMSWGGSEFSGEASYDSAFSHAGVAFVNASGDSGAPASWPATSPNVLGVGGTTLTLAADGTWSSEVGWSGSGGGPSAGEQQPTYQTGVVSGTTMRATPDVAYNASPSPGYAVYDSDPYYGTSYGWLAVGGTSAGAPQWSALLAIADQGRAATGQPALNSTNPQEVMDILYKNPGDFHDITSGTSTGRPHYTAGTGYDYVTGLGSPIANLVIGSLVGTSVPAPDTLVVSAPSTATAGSSFSVTVTADQPGSTTVDTNYTGTVQLTTTDGRAVLPSSYSFTSADAGSHTFTVTLDTAGTQTITATDTTGSAVAATSSGISVSPAAASQLVLSGFPSTATVGVPVSFTVTAKDPYGNVASGYTGTVQFSSSDTAASLPANSTLTSGSQSFTITFATVGSQSVTVTDTATPSLTATQSGINVVAPVPVSSTDSIWSNSYTPLVNAFSYGSYELGVKFTASQAGSVTGVRFYKQTWMGGVTHVGHLWSSTGTLLATATFTNETSYGWQQVNFSGPVAITANTIYIVSFSSGGGLFGITTGFFNRGGVTNGPLQALPNSTPGGDGVYNYSGNFPSVSGAGMNFWVDVAFAPSASPSVVSAASAATSSFAAAGPLGVGSTAGRSGAFVSTTSSAAPAGPLSVVGASRTATVPAVQTSLGGLASRTYLGTIPEARTPIRWGLKDKSPRGSIDA